MIPVSAQFNALKKARHAPEIINNILVFWLADFSFARLLAWIQHASEGDVNDFRASWNEAFVIKLNRKDVFPGELLSELLSLFNRDTVIRDYARKHVQSLCAQLLDEEQMKLYMEISEKCDNLSFRALRLVDGYLRYFKPYLTKLRVLDRPTELSVYPGYPAWGMAGITAFTCEYPGCILTEVSVKAEFLKELRKPKYNTVLRGIERLRVESLEPRWFKALKALCKQYQNFKLELKKINCIGKMLRKPDFVDVLERLISLDTIASQKGLIQVNRLCELNPLVELQLRLGRTCDPEEILSNPHAHKAMRTLDVKGNLFVERSFTQNIVSSLEAICNERALKSISLSLNDGVHLLAKSDTILKRLEHCSYSENVFSPDSGKEVLLFRSILDKYPYLNYEVTAREKHLHALLGDKPPDMEITFLAKVPPLPTIMECKPSDYGLQMVSQDYTLRSSKLVVSIGGYRLSSEVLLQLKEGSTAKHLVVNWLGPIPPTRVIAESLAEETAKHMERVETITTKNFGKQSRLVKKAFEANEEFQARPHKLGFMAVRTRHSKARSENDD